MKKGTIMAMAMLVALGAIAVACKKEQNMSCRKADMTTDQAKDGGDDDEDPVIRGKIRKDATTVVNNAFVETITYGTDVRVGSVYTDSLGDFEQQVPVGTYYFKVTPPWSNIPQVTDTVTVHKDTNVTIFVD